MTATEVFESVTGSGSSDFARLVQILSQHAPWCLIGGLAVNCYVEPVYTLDADIVIVSHELERIKPELSAAGFVVQEFPHSLNANMPGSQFRIQLRIEHRYQEFLSSATLTSILGTDVFVASLPNIVRGKIWAWSDEGRRLTKRKKDELDLIRIGENYPELRKMMPPVINEQLENT